MTKQPSFCMLILTSLSSHNFLFILILKKINVIQGILCVHNFDRCSSMLIFFPVECWQVYTFISWIAFWIINYFNFTVGTVDKKCSKTLCPYCKCSVKDCAIKQTKRALQNLHLKFNFNLKMNILVLKILTLMCNFFI